LPDAPLATYWAFGRSAWLIYDSIAGFHERNMMSNKPHQRPHQKKRQSSQLTRLLVAIIIIAIFALVIALEATGHIIFRGR
jgi:hypothetical protein